MVLRLLREPRTEHLVSQFAGATQDFSFAYLKEAFVSTLLSIAGGDKRDFSVIIMEQVETRELFSSETYLCLTRRSAFTVRKQLDDPEKEALPESRPRASIRIPQMILKPPM